MARIGPCVVVVSIACGVGENGGGAVVRRDSAGVSIVESAEAQWSAEEAWTVDSVPTLSIGEMEGDQGYLFGSVAGTCGSRTARSPLPTARRWSSAHRQIATVPHLGGARALEPDLAELGFELCPKDDIPDP
jgi:hypothetical protein